MFAVAQLWLEAVVTAWTGVVSFPVAQSVRTYFPVLLALGFHGGVLCYWLIIGLQALWRFHESSRRHEREALELMARASALETQVVQARLGALKMQLQPHFLFNTLNAVVSLVPARRGREAEDMLARLSDLLRWVLDDVEQQEVPLCARARIRRGCISRSSASASRIACASTCASRPTPLDAAVPHLCLQPIVENAIRHGIEAQRVGRRAGDRRAPHRRHAGARRRGRRPRLPRRPAAGRHRPRQHRLAPAPSCTATRASLTLANALDGGAIVTLTLPFRECDEPAPPARRRRAERRPRCEPRPRPSTPSSSTTSRFARSGLRLLLEDDEDITSVREAASGRAAIDAMAARRPDLVLLDVQMPGMSGFDVVDTVGAAAMPGVVFVTAHDHYAVRAFEINAIDYLLKPVTASRFSEAMARAKARLQAQEAQSAQLSSLLRTVAAPNQYVTRLAARDGGRTTLIDVDTVEWMKAAENYVELHVGRATHLVHVPLTTLCGWLDPNQFIRVHRSIVVATRMIRDLEPSGHGEYRDPPAVGDPADDGPDLSRPDPEADAEPARARLANLHRRDSARRQGPIAREARPRIHTATRLHERSAQSPVERHSSGKRSSARSSGRNKIVGCPTRSIADGS